jgi:hypothetical protein
MKNRSKFGHLSTFTIRQKWQFCLAVKILPSRYLIYRLAVVAIYSHRYRMAVTGE